MDHNRMCGEQRLICVIGFLIVLALCVISKGCNDNSKLSNEIQKEYIAAGYTKDVLPGEPTPIWVKVKK